jgi:outer membrane protein assembly factor BamA
MSRWLWRWWPTLRAMAAPVAGAAFMVALAGPSVLAQEAEPGTRAATLERAQAEKAADLHPYVQDKAEKYLNYAENILTSGLTVHPFFESAYSGGGFTLGAGYMKHVGSYNTVDVRASFTPSGYKRIETEFIAPRLLKRRGMLSLLGGWREATRVGYYGLGTSNSQDDRANYGFKQPYGVATFTVRPTRRYLVLQGSFEASEWQQTAGSGSAPSVEEVYTPGTLPGLGSSITYLHSRGTVGVDTRPSPGYARRGSYLGVTLHDFTDRSDAYGFTQIEYEGIQHVPILREAWVLSFHGRVATTGTKSSQEIPFFMLPAIGGGSSLRGFSSWRFRDRNSLELQAEWRAMVNRYIDLAVFYDTGKVAARVEDINLDHLKNDVGVGFRFHGPVSTPLRLELAQGNEGLSLIFSASAAF